MHQRRLHRRSAHRRRMYQLQEAWKGAARTPRSRVVDGWCSPRFPGNTPEEGTGGKRPDDQHTTHAASRCAPAFALAHTGHVLPDSATCHQAGEQSLLQQTLSCTRGAPTAVARMTPRHRQTDEESRQRQASHREGDHPQKETSPKIGERSPWEASHREGDRNPWEAHSPANRSVPSNASPEPTPVAQTPSGDSRSIDREFARTLV